MLSATDFQGQLRCEASSEERMDILSFLRFLKQRAGCSNLAQANLFVLFVFHVDEAVVGHYVLRRSHNGFIL